MLDRPREGPCVLAVIPHARLGGHVVLDSQGVVPGSFLTWNLRGRRDKASLVRSRTMRTLRKHRPTCVVVGFLSAEPDLLLSVVLEACRAANVPVAERDVHAARLTILTTPRRRKGETLAALLCAAFFPELAHDLGSGIYHFLYRRHAWNAVALALVEMAKLWPDVVTRLRRPGPHRMPLMDAILDRAKPPDNLPLGPV